MIGHAFDFTGANERRFPSQVAHLLGQPLKKFILRAAVRQKISRSLERDRTRARDIITNPYVGDYFNALTVGGALGAEHVLDAALRIRQRSTARA